MGKMNKQHLGRVSGWSHPHLAVLAGAFCIALLECFCSSGEVIAAFDFDLIKALKEVPSLEAATLSVCRVTRRKKVPFNVCTERECHFKALGCS